LEKLNKLIEQYERENPEYTAINAVSEAYTKKFVLWLASRPTCGLEQRRFLDEVEKLEFQNDKLYSSNFCVLHGLDFSASLGKVIKGE